MGLLIFRPFSALALLPLFCAGVACFFAYLVFNCLKQGQGLSFYCFAAGIFDIFSGFSPERGIRYNVTYNQLGEGNGNSGHSGEVKWKSDFPGDTRMRI